MIHIIKNYKWVITLSAACISFGLLTFFTFINEGFIKLNDYNLQLLLLIDIGLLILFFLLIGREIYKILIDRKNEKSGSETSLRYIAFFSATTLIPSVVIAFFSLILFNTGVQKYFDKKIKSLVNNSSEVAQNYLEQTRNTIEADLLLMVLDINNKSGLYYENPKAFLNLLTSQRLLRRLDEVHLLDSSGNIIMSNIVDSRIDFVPPPEEAFIRSLEGKPIRITDSLTNRTSALVKLNNFIDTYLYIVKFLDPNVINYLNQTSEAVTFYYSVQNRKSGLKITFAIIYVLIVSLLLFLSIIISITFARKLTKPIINLIGASEKISQGDLDTKVPDIETNKEFEKLNNNFNSMIKKLKAQQDKLLIAERHTAWESVARKLAHEIKNPLTPIQLSIDRIKEKYLPKVGNENKNFSSYLDTINKQIKDIEHLVNEFSDFARMPKPVFKEINLYDVISRTLKLNDLAEPKIKFSLSKEDSFNLMADEEQLNRVFLNIIKNSIESIYSKNNKSDDFRGKIDIEITQDSDYIYVEIVDDGIGFAHVDKDKMLTPYYTTKQKGTGLGLSIVTKIINDHNSTIVFNSINEGAKIKITFPRI